MIHIIQYLCPQRHCILAVAYDPAEHDPAEMLDAFKSTVQYAFKVGALNPWCHLCDSRKFTYEDQTTVFATMEEARPELARMEAEQLATRAMVDQTRATRN